MSSIIKGFAVIHPAGMPYSMAIDMWSLGCILAELYTGYPLFPGENEVEQLACIMEIFGVPSLSVLRDAQRKKLFFGESPLSLFLLSLPHSSLSPSPSPSLPLHLHLPPPSPHRLQGVS